MRTILIVAAMCAACSPPLAPTSVPAAAKPALPEEWIVEKAIIRCVVAPCEPPTVRLHGEAEDER